MVTCDDSVEELSAFANLHHQRKLDVVLVIPLELDDPLLTLEVLLHLDLLANLSHDKSFERINSGGRAMSAMEQNGRISTGSA